MRPGNKGTPRGRWELARGCEVISGSVERNCPLIESATGLGLFSSGRGISLDQCAEVGDSLSPAPAPLECSYFLRRLTSFTLSIWQHMTEFGA